MRIIPTKLSGVFLIEPDIHEDLRGKNFMTWHSEKYSWLETNFVEHNIFTAKKNVLSGIHYSPLCTKLYQCLYGIAHYILVNCDNNDKEFGKWGSFILSDENRFQLFKPPKYGTGFVAISNYVIIYVMQSEYYNPGNPNQVTFRYDDPRFNIRWPIENPILSERDEMGNYESRACK